MDCFRAIDITERIKVFCFLFGYHLGFIDKRQKIQEWCSSDSPDSMPRRFRSPYISEMINCISKERFYRKIKDVKDIIESSELKK